MLAIRMQRTGRKGHAMFRVVVQDSRRTPTSGKIVALLGSYDPHQKAVKLDKEKAAFYLEHGAQPSDRSARLLKNEGVTIPAWVKLETDKVRAVRNADKRRSTQPPAPIEETTEEPPVAAASEAISDEAVTPEETPAEEPVADASSVEEKA
jgi:small subunit ribosomal protein S16